MPMASYIPYSLKQMFLNSKLNLLLFTIPVAMICKVNASLLCPAWSSEAWACFRSRLLTKTRLRDTGHGCR